MTYTSKKNLTLSPHSVGWSASFLRPYPDAFVGSLKRYLDSPRSLLAALGSVPGHTLSICPLLLLASLLLLLLLNS